MKWYCLRCRRHPTPETASTHGSVTLVLTDARETPCPRCCGYTTAVLAAKRPRARR